MTLSSRTALHGFLGMEIIFPSRDMSMKQLWPCALYSAGMDLQLFDIEKTMEILCASSGAKEKLSSIRSNLKSDEYVVRPGNILII